MEVISNSFKYFMYATFGLALLAAFFVLIVLLVEKLENAKMSKSLYIISTFSLIFLLILSFNLCLSRDYISFGLLLPNIFLGMTTFTFVIIGAIETFDCDNKKPDLHLGNVLKFFKTINGIIAIYNYIYKNGIPIPNMKPSHSTELQVKKRVEGI